MKNSALKSTTSAISSEIDVGAGTRRGNGRNIREKKAKKQGDTTVRGKTEIGGKQ